LENGELVIGKSVLHLVEVVGKGELLHVIKQFVMRNGNLLSLSVAMNTSALKLLGR